MAVKKAPAKKAPAKKAPAKKAPAKKAPAKKAPAKKAPAKKAPAKKAPAKKAPAKKAPAKKAPAKKAPAKKAPAKKAPAKKATGLSLQSTPVKKVSAKPYDGAFIDTQRELLLASRAEHLEQAQHLRAEADSLVRDREPGDTQFDDEGGEGDSIAVERDFDLHLARQASGIVDEIDEALARIERGVYGICEVSGQRIPKERLQVIPWARERVEYRGSRLR